MSKAIAAAPAQIRVAATYMRGGTSKGIFFKLEDLPVAAQQPGAARDALLLRLLGSPDPYGKQIDGMGGATSSTSKAVILSSSSKPDQDVDYLFGQVSIDKPFVDWSGNCGNLTAAVGAFSITNGLVADDRIPQNGIAEVRIWQANIAKSIVAHVPISAGAVQETGHFELDGVTFPAAEVEIDFLAPTGETIFPTGNLVDKLQLPTEIVPQGYLQATMINVGIPIIFVNASDLGYDGTELQDAINGDQQALARFEAIRAHGALCMGLIDTIEQAGSRQHTPKVAFVAEPKEYLCSSGKMVSVADIDLLVRALSMGQLHHAMMGTAAVAIAAAAAIPGTLVNVAAGAHVRNKVRFGHPSGILSVGAEVAQVDNAWTVAKASMSRSARILMEGWVRLPGNSF